MAGKSIAFVGTKGGIIKSTLTQCIATSLVFADKKVAILEVDPQGSILDWFLEREDNSSLNIKIVSYDPSMSLQTAIDNMILIYDYVFVDLPGESEALTFTRSALAFADLCVFPLRIYHKDINAFDSKMMPVLLEVLELREKKHFILLGTFAHHSADIKKYLSNFDSITVIDKLPAIHRDRPVLTYFSVNGMTLLEYLHSNKTGSTEFIKTQKAVNDIEKIATQILKYVNI